ncbi:MAG: YcgL domain-containing protein [Pseudomonadales bacterium]
MKIISIFKSSKKDEMYLYVEKAKQLSEVPDALMKLFGTALHVMDMPLKEGRELARVDTAQVLKDIDEKGFFLQMPPPKDDYMLDLHSDRPETGVR